MWHRFDTNSTQPVTLPDLACDITQGIGTPDCGRFRREIFTAHQEFCLPLAREYVRIAETQSHREANLRLLSIRERLQLHDLNLSGSRGEIQDFCEKQAAHCYQYVYRAPSQELSTHEAARQLSLYGLEMPAYESAEDWNVIAEKLGTSKWWFRQVRKLQKRAVESVARDIGLVSQVRSAYSSKLSQIRHQDDKIARQEIQERIILTNELGQSYSMAKLAEHSISNPKVRRAELMVRMKGFEEVSQLLGHVGEFYTVTAPSRFHARHQGGTPNANYEGLSPADGQAYLNKLWSLIRSKLHRDGIRVYGFRVAEPHHDGTPHWHLLLFMPAGVRKKVRAIMRSYALQDSPNEPGAERHRFKAVSIDPNKGSATGYIAKYVAKNVDGYAIDQDLYGNDAKAAAFSIETWARTWGIHQFDQIGGPSVGVWRELRRIVSGETPEIEHARKAADSSDWAAYVLAMGGPDISPRSQPVRTAYEDQHRDLSAYTDRDTGEVITSRRVVRSVIGLQNLSQVQRTRTHQWTKTVNRAAGVWASAAPAHAPPGSPLDLCQ